MELSGWSQELYRWVRQLHKSSWFLLNKYTSICKDVGDRCHFFNHGAVALSVERPKGPGLVQLYWRGFESRRCGIRCKEKILAAPSSERARINARMGSVKRKRNCLHVKKNINVLYVLISMNFQMAKFLFGYFSHRPFLTAPSIQLQAVSPRFRTRNKLSPQKWPFSGETIFGQIWPN